MKKLRFYKDCYQMGYETYLKGVHTPEEAILIRPFRSFGTSKAEHAKAISWNKGWNTAKNEAKKEVA